MTPGQRKLLEDLAKGVISNFKHLHESEAIGRVMLLTSKNLESSKKGLSLIREENLLPPGFINADTDGAIAKLEEAYPHLADLMKRLDVVPGKTEKVKFPGFEKPKPQPLLKISEPKF